MKDKRFLEVDGAAVEHLRRQKVWSIPDLAKATGLSVDTIYRIENEGGRRRFDTVREVAAALDIVTERIVKGSSSLSTVTGGYLWHELLEGAQVVADEVFTNNELHVDAVLTFPGPSSIFCGLVLAKLPLKVFIRIPVYTAIFLDSKIPISKQRSQLFHEVRVGSFKVLVPRELVNDKTKRIVVVDDTILTGRLMEELRKFFKKHHDPEKAKFACCICYEGRTLPREQPPEIIGLKDLEPRLRFRMPWEEDSFCFEDAFDARGSASEPLKD